MSYFSLARKLRPSRFDELVGQETTALILRNAVISDRVAHAFLFAGSRGVGKTSAARILTRALNCLNHKNGDPCNNCENCNEIKNNASPDIYEIDAASNRGIDNIRELRENINYVPARCRYKVYIIDEAHMLTLESFNALLKTLEEPPPYVKFILATTDPHKIPQTIISRCQRYDFLRISIKNISDHIEKIIKNEKLDISRKAIEMIARNSVGGMRDALTSIDQILSIDGKTISDKEVAQILGILDNESRFGLIEVLLKKRSVDSIKHFQLLQEHGYDANDILIDLLHTVKTIALIKTLGTEPRLFQDIVPDDLKIYGSLAEVTSIDELQQIFNILLQLEERLKLSSHEKICFEMAILQITSIESLVGVNELIDDIKNLRKGIFSENKSTNNNLINKINESDHNKLKGDLQNKNPSFTLNKKQLEDSTSIKNELKSLGSESQDSTKVPTERINSTFEVSTSNIKDQSQKNYNHLGEDDGLKSSDIFILEKEKNGTDLSEKTNNSKNTDSEEIDTNYQDLDDENKYPNKKEFLSHEKPSQEWIEFSKNVQKQSPKLASFIRNSIPQSLEGSQLELAFKSGSHSSMFTDADKDLLEMIASEFCGRDKQINFSVSKTISSKQTIAEFEDIILEKKKEIKRKNAREFSQVKDVLSVFNNSKITNIDILDE